MRCWQPAYHAQADKANLTEQSTMLSLLSIQLWPEPIARLLWHIQVWPHTLEVVIKLSTLTDITLALDQQGVKHVASIGQMLRFLRLQLEPAGVAKSCTKGHRVRHMRKTGKLPEGAWANYW